jgi:ribosome assembly protein RRB1
MDGVEQDSEVYLPSKPMDKDHILMPDLSAYDMLHSMSVQWPFLSFDIIKDQLGDERRNVLILYLLANESTLRLCTSLQEPRPTYPQTMKFKS